MATPLDTALIDAYTRGVNVPVASQAGHAVRADSDGTNIEYVGPQVLVGSGTWDGKSESILVRGSGARTIVLGDGYYLGQRVMVVDVLSNAAAGNIGISVTGDVVGAVTISTNGGSLEYMYVDEGSWLRVTG